MSRPAPDARCPCGSGRKFKRCCQRLHRGANAASPEALMRSRWSAYSAGLIAYIIDTTDPQGPQFRADQTRWAEEIQAFSAATRFERLEVRECGPIVEGADGLARAFVVFFAKLSRAGEDVSFAERSSFVCREGRWLYREGVEALSEGRPPAS